MSSQKIARARASDALCGVIIGDRTSWQSTLVNETVEGIQEFEEIIKAVEGDPLGKESVTETRKLDKAYDTFVSTLRTEEVFKSVRSGVLPPGVSPKTWFDEDENRVYGMAVYIPSQTNAAALPAEEMKNSQIIQANKNHAANANAKGCQTRSGCKAWPVWKSTRRQRHLNGLLQ